MSVSWNLELLVEIDKSLERFNFSGDASLELRIEVSQDKILRPARVSGHRAQPEAIVKTA